MLFVTVNTLWYGKVAAPAADDPTTRAIKKFNRLTVSHPGLESVILPIRDGLTISRKR